MAVTMYHNPRCNTSRKTLALLREKGVEPLIIEYLKTPPSAAELKKILGQLKMPAAKLVRKKEAAAAGIDPKALSEDDADRGDGQEPDRHRAADRDLGRQGCPRPPARSRAVGGVTRY